MVLKDNRGFTLIELLAVVTIMGILMLVAIPTVTILIQNVRKSVYISDAKSFKNEVQKKVVDQTWSIDDPTATYYIHINNAVDGEPSPSPWADWKDAYVAITVQPNGNFKYYWLSVDEAGWKTDLIFVDDLIRSDVYNSNIKRVNYREAVGDTTKVILLDENGVWREFEPHLELTREEADACYSYEDTSDTTITLTFYDESCGTDVSVPAKIGGKTVDAIHSYTYNNKGLTSVFIPDTIKTIGTRAFAYNNLTQLYVPESVTKIEGEAFMGNKLTNLTLEEGLETMGASCFKSNQLTVALVPNSVTSLGACSYCDNPIPNPSFLYAQNGDVVDYSRLRGYIGNLTEFENKIFVIPPEANGVQLKEIMGSAFSSMSLSGWSVVIPNTVTSIGSLAFAASGISSVTIPNSVTTIGSSAFYNNNLQSINIPDSVTSIGSLAFSRNKVTDPNRAWIYKRTPDGIDYSTIIGYCGANKDNVIIPSSMNNVELTTIADAAFKYSNFKGIISIPESVTSIGNEAFCLNELTDIINGPGDNDGLPIVYSRTSDGGYDKTSILSYGGFRTQHVTIPSYVKRIENSAFFYTYIEGVTIPEGVEYIGSAAFQLCQLKGTVTIPSTVSFIGSRAFEKIVTWERHNADLTKIINKTGRSFDWKSITGGPTTATFEAGTVRNWYGDIEVTRS